MPNEDGHMTDFDRFGRITASVVPAILRSSKQSRKWAWRVVTGREPVRGYIGADAARGNEHEEDAVAVVESQLAALALPGRFVCHPGIDWLGASPDGFLVEAVATKIKGKRKMLSVEMEIPIEAKCPRELHMEIPPMYYDQVQTQLECCNAPYAYFVSWVSDSQRVIKVYRDAAWWAKSYPVLLEFYETYVVPDVEPPRSERRKKGRKDEAREDHPVESDNGNPDGEGQSG